MRNNLSLIIGTALVMLCGCGTAQTKKAANQSSLIADSKTNFVMKLTEAQWKARLTPNQFYILRQEGTERAGTGKYDHFYEKGTYYSAATLQPLFSSATKFDSGTGWPSFYAPITPDALSLIHI